MPAPRDTYFGQFAHGMRWLRGYVEDPSGFALVFDTLTEDEVFQLLADLHMIEHNLLACYTTLSRQLERLTPPSEAA